MRLPQMPPERLSGDQKTFYDRALQQMERGGFTAFKTRADDGALLGPWGVYLHEPSVAQAHYDEVEAITALKLLPENAKQVAILTAGARYKAAYELYAHAATATRDGMDPAKIATIAAGQRPTDLTDDEAIAYDVAAALLDGGVLPDILYRAAVARFGQPGVIELVLWVGNYAQISILLNAFDVTIPQEGNMP